MAGTTSVNVGSAPSLEDVMAALAKQSIFDLPTLARQLVEAAQEKAEAENDPEAYDLLVSKNYVLMHDEVAAETE